MDGAWTPGATLSQCAPPATQATRARSLESGSPGGAGLVLLSRHPRDTGIGSGDGDQLNGSDGGDWFKGREGAVVLISEIETAGESSGSDERVVAREALGEQCGLVVSEGMEQFMHKAIELSEQAPYCVAVSMSWGCAADWVAWRLCVLRVLSVAGVWA